MKKVILIFIVLTITIGIVNINLSKNLYKLNLISQEKIGKADDSSSDDKENLKPCCYVKFLFSSMILSHYLMVLPFENSFITPKIISFLELLYRPPPF